MSEIELKNIYKVYPGMKKPAVNNVSLSIEKGEFLCLLGPSGCGKSTMLRMIAGLENPTKGTIKIKDKIVDDTENSLHVITEKRDLGVVFQNYALWPHMKVAENIAFGPEIKKFSKEETKEIVDSVLEKLSITKYADRYPSELSGGQQQRVAIARTLATKCDIMLLDEPLSNLDARLRLEMRAEFQRIHRDTNATMIFVTHDQWEAMTLATRIVVMNESVIQQIGTPMEIYEKPVNRFVAEFMGSPPLNIIEMSIEDDPKRQLEAWLKMHNLKGASAGVRPENMNFTSRDEMPKDALGVDFQVSGLLPTGGSWIIEVTDGVNHYFGVTTRAPDLTIGQKVTAWGKPEHVLVFDKNTNRVETNFN
ncbi:MAG: ABC transporter ATP-binding protein [Campylobacteraceae bacterium]|nr:ABC transporter ATP-binding protein [Campylobacteraceae bacterium]